MTKKRRAGVIATVVVVLTAGCGTAYALTNDTTESGGGANFCADMPDAVGLYPGNPVTQMGYQVGKVDSVEPKGDHVEVTFSLNKGRNYPADVKAVTRSKSLLADRSLELVGNYKAGPRLSAGHCIARDHSFTPKSISEITGSAADFIDAMSPTNGKESFQKAVAGFDDALRGNGQNAAVMMQHASAAMQSPDQLVADMGSSILNMAPLTEEALQRWATVRSIFDQAPTEITEAAYNLVPGVEEIANAVGWLGNVLCDIQTNYGNDIWPFVHGTLTDVIHLAATRSHDIAQLLDSIPSVAAVLRQQADGRGGLTMSYQAPVAHLEAGASGPATNVPLLDLVLAKGTR